MDNHQKLQDVYIQEYYKALDCPRSLTCLILYRNGEYKQLVELEFDPNYYNDLGSARDSLAATKFLSKATFLKTGNDLKKQAINTFLDAERACDLTNRRIRTSRFSNPLTPSVLTNMIVKIRSILGEFDPEDFVDSCNWGPGASTLLKRREVSYPRKFDVERQITPRAYDFVKDWFHIAYPHWECVFEIVHSSKIVTVPKSAKTDRVIAIEPGINLWFQKGIGALIRRRLRYQGIDLNDQSHNQRLARLGSLTKELSTVDFSSASDTISSALIREILPPRWYALLNSFKVDTGLIDGHTIEFNKFSSMGNGFTFELESLIFYALACSVCYQLGVDTKGLSVYGDDVILPSACYDLFCSISADLGFTVNRRKSYSSSYFRESCGSYYWNGRNIKPIFQKEPLNGKAAVLKAANGVRRSAHSRNSYGCDRRLRRPWQVLARSLGSDTPRLSDGFGDLGLVVDFDDAIKSSSVSRASNGIEGFYVRLWALQNCQRYFDTPGLNLYKLRKVMDSKSPDFFSIQAGGDVGNNVPLSGRYKYSRMRVLVPAWVDLGPWC